LYVIHRYYIFVFIDRANKDACLLAYLQWTTNKDLAPFQERHFG